MFLKARTTMVTKLEEALNSTFLSVISLWSPLVFLLPQKDSLPIIRKPKLSNLVAAFFLEPALLYKILLNCNPAYPVLPVICPEYSCILLMNTTQLAISTVLKF